ncbi:MAG: hypothetical protein NT004_10185 [Bacteroidetes bacterium]|nr:hypothetical protein [Bacteroidota bacterium]
MNLYKILIISLLISGITFSCSSGSLEKKAKPAPLKAGVIHEKVACMEDAATTYALYIPDGKETKGTSGKKSVQIPRLFPVIIAFDPHGDGLLPVRLYKDLAEKYGFFLVGSDNSKNGLPPAEIDAIVATLFNEVKHVYPVDTNRIYLMGFSGGARIASLSAFYKIPVKGVVGCGAGIAGASSAPRYKVDYFGIAGMADFNMNEIVELDYPLSKVGLRHVITTFNGIHAWPPVEVMEEAFQWFTFNAMKDGMIKKDNSLIEMIMAGFDKKIEFLKTQGDLIDAAATCRKAISFDEGFTATDKFSDQLKIIEKLNEYQVQVAYRNKIMKDEDKERKELMGAMSEKDLGWWKDYVRRRTRDEGRGTMVYSQAQWRLQEDALKDQRLLAFLRLLAYMNATSVLTSKNEEAAAKIIAIYEIADPENPEANYLHAILLARKPANGEALEQLGKAIEKGFSDKLRMTEQPEFASMKDKPQFYDLLQKMK